MKSIFVAIALALAFQSLGCQCIEDHRLENRWGDVVDDFQTKVSCIP